MDGVKIPDFLHKGGLVKVQYLYGEIEDVCLSDTRIMVLVKSPKGVWRNHPSEWLEYQPGQILPATPDEAVNSIDMYRERIQDMLRQLEQMGQQWQAKPMNDLYHAASQ